MIIGLKTATAWKTPTRMKAEATAAMAGGGQSTRDGCGSKEGMQAWSFAADPPAANDDACFHLTGAERKKKHGTGGRSDSTRRREP